MLPFHFLPWTIFYAHLVPQTHYWYVVDIRNTGSIGVGKSTHNSCNGKSLVRMGLTRERWCCARGQLSRLEDSM